MSEPAIGSFAQLDIRSESNLYNVPAMCLPVVTEVVVSITVWVLVRTTRRTETTVEGGAFDALAVTVVVRVRVR